MKNLTLYTAAFSALLAGLASAGISAAESQANNFSEMISNGKVGLDFRYRYEYVDQKDFVENARASTLRSRLNFTSAPLNHFSFKIEFDNVSSIGSEDYNSTANGQTQYPVVADPTGTEINQAYLKYANPTAAGILGRQRILHSNQRFVGGVAWRQNEQTFDAVRAELMGNQMFKLDYSYVDNVNRLFGPDDGANPANLEGQNHFLMADWNASEQHKVSGFAYWLDFDSQSDYSSSKTVDNSSDTWGLEYNGNFEPAKLHAAWASQSDAGDSTLDYDANYYVIDGSVIAGPITLGAGFEVLGAGDGVGFKTPLATLHKFQGWADKFLSTPGDGIEDISFSLAGKAGPIKLQAIYHDFSAEQGDADFGTEIDLAASWPVNKHFSTQLKFADFSSKNEARYSDTTKGWLTLQLKY